VSALDAHGRTTWIADAHRGDGKRFVVHADEKLTAFLELESAIRSATRGKSACCENLPLVCSLAAGSRRRITVAFSFFPAPNSTPPNPSISPSSSVRASSFAPSPIPSTPIPRESMQPRQRSCATRIADPHSGQTTDDSCRWKQTDTLFIGNATI
jgi:hypothetical protein